jgi:hypothetical protein
MDTCQSTKPTCAVSVVHGPVHKSNPVPAGMRIMVLSLRHDPPTANKPRPAAPGQAVPLLDAALQRRDRRNDRITLLPRRILARSTVGGEPLLFLLLLLQVLLLVLLLELLLDK